MSWYSRAGVANTLLLILYFVCVAIMLQYIVSDDVTWYVYIADCIKKGGNYFSGFIDPNPPFIACLYMIIGGISHAFHLSLDLSIKLFALSYAIFPIIASYGLLQRVFDESFFTLRYLWLSAFIISLTVLPGFEFIQREIILMMGLVPYLLLLALRLQSVKVNTVFACLIGLFAGVGIGLKPYFLIPWVLVEGYAVWRSRRFSFLIRPEMITLGAVLIFYAGLLCVFFRPYLFQMIPFSLKYYYLEVSRSWPEMIIGSGYYVIRYPLFFYGAVILYCYFRHVVTHKTVLDLVLLAMIGMFLSYLLQRTLWPYHALPFFIFSLLLTVQIGFEINRRIFNRQGPLSCKMIFLVCGAILLNTIVFLLYFFLVSALVKQSFFKNYATGLKQFTQIIKRYSLGRPVLQLSIRSAPLYPYWIYSGAQPGMQFYQLWHPAHLSSEQNRVYTQQIQKIYLKDLLESNPNIIIIDHEKTATTGAAPYDYISFFSQNQEFKRQFSRYHFLTTLYKGKFSVYVKKIPAA